MRISIAYEFLPKTPTVRASCVMDHFGLGLEQGRHVIADDLELPIEPGQVVLFTGPSGSGKSSLMRGAAKALSVDGAVLDIGGCLLASRCSLIAFRWKRSMPCSSWRNAASAKHGFSFVARRN